MQALLPIDFFLDPQAKCQMSLDLKKLFDEQVCYLYYISKKRFYMRSLEKDFNLNKTYSKTLKKI